MNAPAPRKNVRLLVGVDGGGTGVEPALRMRKAACSAPASPVLPRWRLGIDRSLAAVENACRAAAA